MYQNRFRLGLQPRGAYSAPPDSLAVFKGPISKGRRGREERREREGEGRGEEGKNDLTHPLSQIPGYATACHVKKLNAVYIHTCMTDVVCMFCSMYDAKQISLKPYEP